MDPKLKIEKRLRRGNRIKAKIQGTAVRPRLCVFRANRHIYAQLIDDDNGKTLASASDLAGKNINEVGKLIAKKGQDLKIKKVIFDKGGYKYHGKVEALAEAAREGGLIF